MTKTLLLTKNSFVVCVENKNAKFNFFKALLKLILPKAYLVLLYLLFLFKLMLRKKYIEKVLVVVIVHKQRLIITDTI